MELGEEGGAYLVAVGGRRLAELVGVVADGVVLLVRGLLAATLAHAGGVGGGAKVHQAGLLGEPVQLRVGRSRQQGQSESGEMHVGAIFQMSVEWSETVPLGVEVLRMGVPGGKTGSLI